MTPIFKRLAAILPFLAAMPASAQDMPPSPSESEYQDFLGIGTKKLKVWSSLKVEQWFDNNILLTDDDEESDAITAIIPAIGLRWDHKESRVQLNYRGRQLFYADNDDFNGMEHFVDGLVHFKTGKFWTDLRERLQLRRDPFDVLPAQNPRIDVLQNDVTATFGADFDKADAEAYAGLRTYGVDDDVLDSFDHRRVSFGLLGLYEIMPKTSGILEYGYTGTEFDDDATFNGWTSHRVVAGVRGTPTAKLRTTAKAGVVIVDADEGAAIPSDDFTGPYIGIAADWDVAAQGVLSVSLFHQPVESIFTGLAVSSRLDASYEHKFTPKISATGGVYYNMLAEVEGADTDRRVYGVNAGALYKFNRHFSADAWVEFRAKSADLGTFEYSDMRGYLGVAAGF